MKHICSSLLILLAITVPSLAHANLPLHRNYPPRSPVDTIGKWWRKPVKIYKDEEILYHDKIVYSKNPPEIARAQDGKAVIQQQAIRGCTAAAAAMLILDHGKKFNLEALKFRNLGTTEDIVRDITAYGLRAKVTTMKLFSNPQKIEDKRIREINALLMKNGPAIISVNTGPSGNHVIVLDSIDEVAQSADIREPYHGWKITITLDALVRSIHHECINDIIQIDK